MLFSYRYITLNITLQGVGFVEKLEPEKNRGLVETEQIATKTGSAEVVVH